MVAVLAKLGTAADVGSFYLGLSIAAPVVAVTALQLRTLQATDIKGEFTFASYFGAQVILSTFGFLLIVAFAFLGPYASEVVLIIVLVGLAKIIDSQSEVVRGLFQRYERMDLSALSIMLKASAGLLILSMIFIVTRFLPWASGGLAAVTVLVYVAYDLRRAKQILDRNEPGQKQLAPDMTWASFWAVARRALPLSLGMFLLTLQSNIPRYVLEAEHGEASLGYFGAMAYLPAVGTLVVSALGQSASPRLATLYIHDRPGYRRLIGKLMLLALGMGVAFVLGVSLFGELVMGMVYQKEYAQFPRELFWFSIQGAISFVTFFLGFALIATRVFRSQWVAGVLTCLASFALSYWLVPKYGIFGGAITLVLTTALTLACYLVGLWWRLSESPEAGLESAPELDPQAEGLDSRI